MRLIPPSLALALVATQSPAHADVAAHPALWQVKSPTATIYLFGTIHALPKGIDWRTPALKAAEAKADRLALELIDTDDKAEVSKAVREMAIADGLPDVLDRVPANKRAMVKAFFEAQGAQPALFNRFKTWGIVLFVLTPVLFKALDADPQNGVETGLKADFNAAHKPLEGLETLRFQMGVFDHLSEAAQRQLLVQSIEDLPKARADFMKTLRAWESGDARAIAANFDTDLKANAVFKKALLHDRNANWANIIAAKLKGAGTTLIAVGAGHLAGDDSVIAMLRRRGFKVQRVG